MAKPNPAENEVQAGDPLLPNWKEQALFWSISGVGIAADLWTKSAVHAWLKDLPGQVYPVIDSCLQLVLRENTGAAFSMAQGKTGMLAIVSMVAMVAVVGIFLFGKVRSRLLQVAMALFLAGIVGNLYDRAFNPGGVRDFIDAYWGKYHWPAFNVADSMLCVGMGILILTQFLPVRKAETKDAPAPRN
jgi:signal peptidase II